MTNERTRRDEWLTCAFWAALFCVACALFEPIATLGWQWALVLAGSIGALAIWLTRIVGARVERLLPTPRARVIGLLAGIAVGAALCIVSATTDLDEIIVTLPLLGLALAYLTIGIALTYARSRPTGLTPSERRVLVVGVVTALLTLTIVAAGPTWTWVRWAALAGFAVSALVMVPIGLNLTSETLYRRIVRRTRIRNERTAVVAAGLLVIGVLAFIADGTHPAVACALGVLAYLLMLGFVARTGIDVVAVIVALAIVWALAHQASVPLPDELRPSDADTVLAAFGDSYMSGEGATEYFQDTNDDAGRCRRSPTAYPVRLVQPKPDGTPSRIADHVIFSACSGAVANEVTKQVRDAVEERSGVDDISLVLLSMGGNDAHFGTIARTCLSPADCSRLQGAYLQQLDDVTDTLAGAYRQIATSLPGVRVVVVPYPVPVAPRGCGHSLLSDREHLFLSTYTRQLNRAIRVALSESNSPFEYAAPVEDALQEGRLRLCDARAADDEGINFIAMNGVRGALSESINPKNWIHNSFHPNERGHRQIASTLSDWLREQPAQGPIPSRATTRVSDDAVCRRVADLASCTDGWTIQATARELVRLLPYLAVLAAGAWLLALETRYAAHRLRRRNDPPLDDPEPDPDAGRDLSPPEGPEPEPESLAGVARRAWHRALEPDRLLTLCITAPALMLGVLFWQQPAVDPVTAPAVVVDRAMQVITLLAVPAVLVLLLGRPPMTSLARIYLCAATATFGLSVLASGVVRQGANGAVLLLATAGVVTGVWALARYAPPAFRQYGGKITVTLGISAAVLPALQLWHATSFGPSQAEASLLHDVNVEVVHADDDQRDVAVSFDVENPTDVRTLVLVSRATICWWSPDAQVITDDQALRDASNCRVTRPIGMQSWISPKSDIDYQVAVPVPASADRVTVITRIAYARGDRLKTPSSSADLGSIGYCRNVQVNEIVPESRMKALSQHAAYLLYADVNGDGGLNFYFDTGPNLDCPSESSERIEGYLGTTVLREYSETWLTGGNDEPAD